MKLVIDASVALAWLFERQKKEEANCAERVLLALEDAEEALVPNLWHIEIANALLVGERRQVVTEAQVVNYLTRLTELPVMTDEVEFSGRRDLVMALAREHHLTAYDAVYLDLALRNNSILATFDTKLSNAMQDAGGTVFT